MSTFNDIPKEFRGPLSESDLEAKGAVPLPGDELAGYYSLDHRGFRYIFQLVGSGEKVIYYVREKTPLAEVGETAQA